MLDVNVAVGEHRKRMVPTRACDCLQLRDDPSALLSRNVVEGAAGIHEIEETARNPMSRVGVHPPDIHAVGAGQPRSLLQAGG
jgi:hypothetical protein